MIYVNARFLTHTLTGVQRFAFNISLSLNKLRSDICFLLPPGETFIEIPTNFKTIVIGNKTGHLWEQIDLPLYLSRIGYPLLLNFCNTAPVFYKNNVSSIHDLAFIKGKWHSWTFRTLYKLFIPEIIKSSKHILTVSNFSKNEIINQYGTLESKISVIYNAPFTDNITACPLHDFTLNDNFIISIGSVEPRKNLKRLIKAFLGLKDKAVSLYLIGAYNNNFNHDAELEELLEQHTNRIKFLGYRTDSELVWLYQNSLIFVFPSLYEGFGLPPIEAMANSCPVIVSNVASLPEVCGEAAIYVDPFESDDISVKIDLLLSDAELRVLLKDKGIENVKRFSWEMSARNLNNLIDDLNISHPISDNYKK